MRATYNRGVNNRGQNRHNINCPNCRQCQFCIDPRSTRYQTCTCSNIRLFCQRCINLRQSTVLTASNINTTIVGPLQLSVPTTSTRPYTPPHRLDTSISPTPFEICCCGDIINCISKTKCKVKNPPHCGRECDICRMRKREREQSNTSSSTSTIISNSSSSTIISNSRSSTTVSYTESISYTESMPI